MSAAWQRASTLDRLDRTTVDLLVVGAGIVGSRIAFEAARYGLRVALVDAGDFGGGTSSASSKLVHGGLRYLATGDLGLVRQLQAERRTILRSVAPHLVRPLPLVLAVERGQARRSAKLLAALALYGACAGSHTGLPRVIGARRAGRLVPGLDPAAVTRCGLVSEAQTHDARLTLGTVRGAAARGALVMNHVRLVGLHHAGGRVVGATLEDLAGGTCVRVACRAAVNATGPWVDRVRLLDDPRAQPLARLSKGVHAVLPLDEPWAAGVAVFDDARTAIAVPWQGMLLVGATDTEHDGPPTDIAPQPGEIDEVIAAVAPVLDDRTIDRARVVHAFAGLRVLPRRAGDTARASREHVVELGPTGLISIAGGKLTTHRTIAVDALSRLPSELRPRRLCASIAALPGAGGSAPRRTDLDLDAETSTHLLGLYGAETRKLVAYLDNEPNALERLHPGGPDVVAQVLFARDAEYAVDVDDVVRRRTTLAVRGLDTAPVRARVAELLGTIEPSPTRSAPRHEMPVGLATA